MVPFVLVCLRARRSRLGGGNLCVRVFFWLIALSLMNVFIASAQDASTEQGIKPYGSYHGGELDSINMVNGKLILHIPLISYPQRGSKLHLGFSISYHNPFYVVQDSCNGVPNCIPKQIY